MLRNTKQTYMVLAYSAFVGVASAGCQRLEEPAAWAQIEAIPAEYGQLVGITEHENPYIAVLWFEQPDKTLVAVKVNTARGQIAAQSIKFPRNRDEETP
jgi:hypothetical protein